VRHHIESLQVRVPLSLVLVTLATFLCVSIAIGIQTSINLYADQKRALEAQAHALAPILTNALLHDEVWMAYTAVRGPKTFPSSHNEDDPFHLVINDKWKVFVSDHPKQFPLSTRLDQSDLGKRIRQLLPEPLPAAQQFLALEGRQLIYAPLLSEDTPIGAVIIVGPRGAIRQRLFEILESGLLVMGGLLLVITPFGWAWGSRMVKPLVRLADCMRRVGKDPIEELECPIYAGQDEIGQLAHGFQTMLKEMHAKQALERQMLAQDRLAAIGRIAGGVAHEINNPLAGMLVAIDTFKQQPAEKQDPLKTLGLIERGLSQILDTVSALLVECRIEQRQCTPEDIEDIHRLVLTNEATHSIDIHWQNDMRSALQLPATAIRQILLNLSLNALQAAAERPDGIVEVVIHATGKELVIEVSNTGIPIPQAELEKIFEPFHTGKAGGTGLGLWITYQVVNQLDGEIVAMSDENRTSFRVSLPCSNETS